LANLPDENQMFIVERQVGGDKSCLSRSNFRASRAEIHERISQMDSRIKDAQVLLGELLVEQ
jgi:hypothetical protein